MMSYMIYFQHDACSERDTIVFTLLQRLSVDGASRTFLPWMSFLSSPIACEISRFSSLLAAEDVPRGGTSTTQRQKFHTDDVKSVRNPVRSADWSTEQLHCFSYCLRMTDKRPKATKVKCKRDESITKQSIFLEYILLQCQHLSFANEHNNQNRPGETLNRTNVHSEPHDYRIYYVNTDLRHEYEISVAESQTFLLARRSQRRGAAVFAGFIVYRVSNGSFSRSFLVGFFSC